ncbi:MAG: hypothetical protein KC620_18125, partial [Myxococcales bacterium]|nr:hypothetical protein [Myxococcales bacterium]
HDKTFASLKAGDDVLRVTLERALVLLAEKAQRGKKPEALRELGAHPGDKALVVVMAGRYGPYVKHQGVNATLPEGMTAENVTLAQAVALLAAKADAKPARGRAGARRAAGAKKTPAAPKAAAPKKPAAKKAPAKKAPAAKKTTTAKAATTKATTAKAKATTASTEPATPASGGAAPPIRRRKAPTQS